MPEFTLGFGSSIPGLAARYNAKGFGLGVVENLLFAIHKDKDLEKRLNADNVGTSQLGTPVSDELIIQPGRYFSTEDDGSGFQGLTPISYPGLKIQTALIEINQAKNIVTTSIQGRAGTIKEFVADGDYSLTISGLLVGENTGDLATDPDGATVKNIGNFYPKADALRLNTILKVPASIRLTSRFLNIFGISDCVVMSYSIPQNRATKNVQPFQINLLSDFPIDFNEIEVL